MAEPVELSDAEWQVMNLIWDRPPSLAQKVLAPLAEPCGWTPATIRTMLHRLVKKGTLDYRPDGLVCTIDAPLPPLIARGAGR